ncbi:MAG TPA: 3-hydroxyacyl-ACP dehydratase FabZ [Coriobacteriaceae bacterium]|nr:3-hydroxyacyl-ACP dehydratase FabZ [Coriobacteriaceae bacterium]
MEISYPAGRDVIESVLPHRDPFVWVSRVLECEPGVSVKAELDVDPALPLFAGHFLDYPVLPGVIIMEALAQAASFSILVEREAEGTLGFFAGIDNAKFRNQVRPGDTLTLEATIVKSSRRMCVAEVKASVGDTVCATATQKYVLATAE